MVVNFVSCLQCLIVFHHGYTVSLLFFIFLHCGCIVPLLPPAFRRNGEGTVFTGVCLFTFLGGVPPSCWQGYPQSGLDRGTPLPQDTEQHSEYLLRGRWYASCIHARGLSCCIIWWFLYCMIIVLYYAIVLACIVNRLHCILCPTCNFDCTNAGGTFSEVPWLHQTCSHICK